MNNSAVGNRPDIIQRFTPRIAMQAANVDSLVEAGVGQALYRRHRIADEAITATLPWSRFLTVEVAFDVLIKFRATAAEECVVIGRQADLDF